MEEVDQAAGGASAPAGELVEAAGADESRRLGREAAGVQPARAGEDVAAAPTHLEPVVSAYAEIEWQHLATATSFSQDVLSNAQPKAAP